MNAFSYRSRGLRRQYSRDILREAAADGVIDLASDRYYFEDQPSGEIKQALEDIYTKAPSAFEASFGEGYGPLVQYLGDRLHSMGCFHYRNDGIIITSGATHSAEIAAMLVCNEGDAVICGEYAGESILGAFSSCGARLVGVPSDDEGMSAEGLEKALKENGRTAFLYVMPDHEEPTGVCMSVQRRSEIIELARRYNILVVENVSMSNLGFSGEILPALRSLDDRGNVITISSFADTVSPALNVGFICAEKGICAKAAAAVHSTIRCVDPAAQMIVYRLLSSGQLEEHLNGLCAAYYSRCQKMLFDLSYKMPSSFSFSAPEGGRCVWGTLPFGEDPEKFFRRALEYKVAVMPGRVFLTEEGKSTLSFRISFSQPDDEAISRGVGQLAAAAGSFYG